ncbi:MAG: serine/threonine protein kinase, partial [Thermoleophilia bacterium]|nr:serine/threonine protein kinase [Thermoleophilia bacterium]
AVLERPTSEERAAYLDGACAGDPALRRRIERLLEVEPRASGFLDRPADVARDVAGLAASAGRAESPAEETTLDFLAPPGVPGSLGRLDHFEVLEVVGRGTMGIVLKARDERLERVVAIKVLAPVLAAVSVARHRFAREARAAAAVAHDHVIAIHAVEDRGPVPYLVMRFIGGRTLQQKLDAEGVLPLEEILRIGLQVAEGLAAAHRQGLVHRDIKPANILLENAVERVKITDFGLARAVDDASLTQSGLIAGTPSYMSPEQANGDRVDHRSDLFSLGSVLYALATGHAPFRAESTMGVLRRVCDHAPRPLRESNPAIPHWLERIIARLHAKNPAARYQTADELAGELRLRLAALQQSPQRARRVPIGRGAGAALLGVLAVTGGAAIWSRFQAPGPAATATAVR